MNTQIIKEEPIKEEPMGWLKRIPSDLFSLDQKPLIGDPPVFPWLELSNHLESTLRINDLSIIPSELQWRSPDDLFSGLGGPLRGLSIGVLPIEGPLWWAMPEREISHLIELLITETPTASSEIIDRDFISTFYRFLSLEILNAIEAVQPDKQLSLTLASGESLPTESSLCMDVGFTFKNTAFMGRLFLSPKFRSSWTHRYKQPEIRLNSPAAETLDVIVHLEAGRINLKTSEWNLVSPGDFIILDKCSMDPDDDKGRVLLVIAGIPFFRAKIKNNTLKILEHPLHYEVNTIMDNTPNTPDDDIDLGDDFNFDEETTEDSTIENSTIEDSSESDVSNEEELQMTSDLNEAETEDKSSQNHLETKATIEEVNQPAAKMHLEDIPLPIVIEIGRIQLSIKKLLELQPGNMLDLDIHPDASVDMVVHGKRIARAELLRVGDSLGVRILELS